MAKRKSHRRYASLAAYLEGEGVSHGAFARRVKVTQSYVTQLLRDPTRQPALDIAVRMAAEARIPVSSLVRRRRPPPPVID